MAQLKKKKSASKRRKTPKESDHNTRPPVRCWVDELSFEPVSTVAADADADVSNNTHSFTVISWNVLAEAYCSRRSHPHLPHSYQSKVFDRRQRKELLLEVLTNIVTSTDTSDIDSDNDSGGSMSTLIDVVCLQEVDLDEIGETLRELGYEGIETPRTTGGGAGGRSDACALYCLKDRWTLVEHELVRLDDLATRGTSSNNNSNTGSNDSSNDGDGDEHDVSGEGPSASASSSLNSGNNHNNNPNTNYNLQGLQQSFLRRNGALIARLRHNVTGRTVVVANTHLYWNPACEHVKLCQAHYILERARAFWNRNTNNTNNKDGNGNDNNNNNEPLVFCGDLNSRPNSVTHSYLTRGYINAKHIAPWYRHHWSEEEGDEYTLVVDDEEKNGADATTDDDGNDDDDEKKEQGLVDLISHLQIAETPKDERPPDIFRVRYMLDATLNKLCRWLRILGQDVALETEEEERRRTADGDMVVFQRCRDERRTFVTTSTRLMQRRDCPPGTYCISPVFLPTMEVAMVHMLLNHGVVLEPDTFLSRCVVCNGKICEKHDPEEKKRILRDYQAPPDLSEEMEVYECDGCQQGYWWCDKPTSSASRVKIQATRLFELCLRGGVPVQGDVPHMFTFVDIKGERERGWDYTEKGSELMKQQLDVVDWLKDEHLSCPFNLESAYAFKDDKGSVVGEKLPFTNVTHSFIDTLDYIFFDKERLTATDILDIPTSFPQLNNKSIKNGHLLPSDVWPSDHMAIGARLTFSEPVRDDVPTKEKEELPPLQFCMPTGNALPAPPVSQPASVTSVHKPRCACGCVPNVLSMFEMAALRKQAKLQKAIEDAKQ